MADLSFSPRLLWKHRNPESTATYAFKAYVEKRYSLQLADYEALRQWSIENLNDFWADVATFTSIIFAEASVKVTSP